MIETQVKQLCMQLRLLGLHESLERRTAESLAKQLHPLEFLQLLLEDETLQRKDRLGKTLMTRAKFRFGAALEDWDSSYDRGLNRAQLTELSQLGFFHRAENLLIFGKTGEGKTHLAISLGERLCHDGLQTTFMPVNTLFAEVAAAKAAGRGLAFLRHLARAKVLLLDDFGMRSYTHEEATTLLDVIEDRYRKGSIMVTSQVCSDGWQRLFEDAVVAEAIVDRLIHPSHTVVLRGGSYRERMSHKSKP